MRILLLLTFILSACGDDDSTPSSNTTDLFPYGTYQTTCQLDTSEESGSITHHYSIISEEYSSLNKTFIKTSNFYTGLDSCLVQSYKTSSYFTLNIIEYNSDKDLYTVELNFIKTTITPSSKIIATGFNNMNLAGINTWKENVETDVTGKNPDGTVFTPAGKKYKIIKLSNNNTQLVQNESDSEYPESLDHEHLFYKQD